jgi:hypothetical protein
VRRCTEYAEGDRERGIAVAGENATAYEAVGKQNVERRRHRQRRRGRQLRGRKKRDHALTIANVCSPLGGVVDSPSFRDESCFSDVFPDRTGTGVERSQPMWSRP